MAEKFPIKAVDRCAETVLAKKYKIITGIYGFGPDSVETQTPHPERRFGQSSWLPDNRAGRTK